MTRAPRTPRRRAASAVAAPSLSSSDWTVLALVLVERLSLTEAACAMNTDPASVRRRYERALSRLRRAVAPLVRAGAARSATAMRGAS